MTILQRSARRTHLHRVFVVMVIALAASGCNWIQSGFDPANTYNNSLEGLLPNAVTLGNVGAMTEAWSAQVSGAGAPVSEPVVYGGTVLVTSNGYPGQLHSFAVADGRTQWTADVGPVSVLSPPPPAIADGKVLTVSEAGVRAFDLAGKNNCAGAAPNRVCTPIWQTNTVEIAGVAHATGTLMRVVVANDLAYVSGNDGYVVALSVHDGSQVWIS